MERDKIPLHNEKYSKTNDVYQKNTEIIRKGFYDNTLPTPSHVILSHINSWETMVPISGPPSVASTKDSVTSPSADKRSLELPKVTTVEDEGAEVTNKTESDLPQ
jgi:hypothetical protein